MASDRSNYLPLLQSEVFGLNIKIRMHTEECAKAALLAGAKLAEAKELCPHGQWAEWLAGARVSERTAQRYIKLHRGGCESATVADLGMAKAETLSSAGLRLWPAEGRSKTATFHDADGIEGFAAWREIEPGRVRYASLALVPTSPMTAIPCTPNPLRPWQLGAIHDWHRSDFHHVTDGTIEEAEELFALVMDVVSNERAEA